MSETKVTAEEEKEAIRLGLPPKFFAYKQLPSCSCDQCKKDDIYLKDLFEDSAQKSKEQSTKCFGSTQNVTTTTTTSNTSIFTSINKSPLAASPEVSSNASSNTSQTIKQLLVKPSLLNIVETKTPVTTEASSNVFKTFSFSLNPSQAVTTTTTTTTVATKPVFGSAPFTFGSNTPLFGTAAATTSNVFGEANNTASTGVTTTTTSVFGSNSGLFSTSNTSLFSGGLFKSGGNGESIFGTNKSDNKSIFGSGSVFGSTPSPFSNPPAEPKLNSAEPLQLQNTSATSAEKEVILPSDPNLTFASLAASSQNKPAFGKKTGRKIFW